MQIKDILQDGLITKNTSNITTLSGLVIQLSSPTGKTTFVSSTTGFASINIPSGATPTNPSNGDIWNDATDGLIEIYKYGLKEKLSGTLSKNTNWLRVANTNVET